MAVLPYYFSEYLFFAKIIIVAKIQLHMSFASLAQPSFLTCIRQLGKEYWSSSNPRFLALDLSYEEPTFNFEAVIPKLVLAEYLVDSRLHCLQTYVYKYMYVCLHTIYIVVYTGFNLMYVFIPCMYNNFYIFSQFTSWLRFDTMVWRIGLPMGMLYECVCFS